MEKIIKIINKKKGIDDEVCTCGHSKGYHLDESGRPHHGRCEMCSCKHYTYTRFVTYQNWRPKNE